MATKGLTFTSKIKVLEGHLNVLISFSQPPPQGTELANTIRYFTNALLAILKDAPSIKEKFHGAKYAKSNVRIAMFPTLDYSRLYNVMCGLLPVVHLVIIQADLLKCLLQLVTCMIPFLSWDQLTQLPYKVALMLPFADPSQYADIVQILCVNLLPNSLGRDVDDNLMTTEAIAGMLLLILQYCEDPKLHSMFIESLLPLRDHLYKDLFSVIAYGPPNTKIPAVVLLFHYWPQLNRLLTGPSLLHDNYSVVPWHVPICQRVQCINKIARSTASKMCIHPSMCAAECELPPPAFICVDCYDTHGMRIYDDSFMDIVLPSEQISRDCGNKSCPAPGSNAVALCTSLSCVKMNRFRPVSLCFTCHMSRHPGDCAHVQQSIENLWTLEPETQSYVVDGIVNLLREAESNVQIDAAQLSIMDPNIKRFMATKNPINSRYGILLLKELCQPRDALNVDALGRLLGMLFHWFQCTGRQSDATSADAMERLKTEFMTEWLQGVKKSYYEVILSTLLPHPPDFAKVGGQWERLSGRTDQLKEGLDKLIMLGPYDIVTYEVWDYIMPYWLESIRTELTLKEREEIKIPLRQTFDVEMSPLPFLIDKMYHFIAERFESQKQEIQEQGLQWLQILTSVDIAIPFLLLLNMCRTGTTSLLKSNDESITDAHRTPIEIRLNCFILMLDIILKQSQLSGVIRHGGVAQNKSKEMFILLNDMITCIKPIKHSPKCGSGKEGCKTCQRLTVFYQLTLTLLESICPLLEASLPVLDIKQLAMKKEQAVDVKDDGSVPIPPLHSIFVSLLQVLETDKDLDIVFYIISSLKVLFVHGLSLNTVHRTHPACVEGFLQQQFIPRLWTMLDSKQSRTSKLAVVMLFHAIALGNGHKFFWTIVNGDCMHRNWQTRYAAVDKIRMVWESSSANFLSKNQIVMTSLAHVFCQYVTLLHDEDHNVAQRALLQLRLLGEVALQAVVRCMSVQFDVVVKDRQLILNKLSQLQNVLPDRQVFSWSFFLARLQQLFVEAELNENSSESSSVRGSMVKVGTDQNLDQMMKIAQFAAMRCDSVSSIRDLSGVYEKSSVSLTGSVFNIAKDKKMAGGQFLKYKGKKKNSSHSDNSLQDEVMPEIGSENAKIIKTLWKAMENDKLDHSVLHLLICTIVKYMSSPVTNEIVTDEPLSSKQTNTIEHIFYLLGYADGRFFVKPSQLRASPVIDALLTNLPKFLDGNVEMGMKMLPDCLNVLRFSGSPQKYASDNQSADYTLVYLPRSLTKYWVQSLLIIMYKYHYCNNPELSSTINYLVRIVLNTLSSIPHCCKQKERDTESVSEVQGMIQGMNDQEHSTHKPDHEESGTHASATSQVENSRQRSTTVLPGAGLLIGASAVIHEEDELDPLSISRRSTIDRSELASKLANPTPISSLATKSSRGSQSPALQIKKVLTQDAGKLGKKGKKLLQRQSGVDQGSPAKADPKLKHWKTVDSKADDFLSALENPQKLSSSSAANHTSVDKQEGDSVIVSPTAVTVEFKKTADFMARSKRGQNYSVAKKQDSGDSAEHTGKHGAPFLTPSSSVKRMNCPECLMPLESYTEEVLVLCVVAMETYVSHDLNEAASMVYEMIRSISRVASTPIYSWQNLEHPVFVPGNVTSSALQFLRCTLHHLHPYNIMAALLLSSEDSQMFKVIVTALTDFPELSCQQALLTALEGINDKAEIKKFLQLVENLNSYLLAITQDISGTQEWPKIIDQLEIFFRKLTTHLPDQSCDLSSVLSLMTTILKLPTVTHKGDRVVESGGKLIASALPMHTFNMIQLAKLCQLCYSTFSKEREKNLLAKMIVYELMQVLRYRSSLPEANVLTLLEIVCMDCGSTLLPSYITNEIPSQLTCDMIIETGIIDVMRAHLNEAIEFVSDLHTLLKLKALMKSSCLHEDTFGGLMKTGIAQIIALEMSATIQKDAKGAQKIIPWLYNQPNTIQRGSKEFLESVDHVRFLCWLYIGALTHHAVAENVLRTKCQPLPLDDVNNISVMVMSIMTGFVEYSSSSVEFMSSLFYGFILCQVWTMYCETLTMEGIEREPEVDMDITQIIFDFWAKVTPTILNLMSHSRVLTEMVTLHVLSLMETLQECQSAVVVKLFPLWRQLMYSNQNKLPTNILVRLQTLENWQPLSKKKFNKAILFDWIKKVQFKLAQIEVQSSTAVKFLAI